MSATTEDKVRENRLRRMAQRQGFLLRKSRRRDPLAIDYGLYVLVDDTAGNRFPDAQAPISEFAKGWGMTLEEVERVLTEGGGP